MPLTRVLEDCRARPLSEMSFLSSFVPFAAFYFKKDFEQKAAKVTKKGKKSCVDTNDTGSVRFVPSSLASGLAGRVVVSSDGSNQSEDGGL